MTHTPEILLFDIDGTLMHSGGAGLRSMDRIFQERHGVPQAFNDFDFQGKMDPAIFRETLRRFQIQVPDEDAEIQALIRGYEAYIAEEMPKSAKARMMPGVRDLLGRLQALPISIGLLTGNVIGGAQAKLKHFDLWKYFPYGAFGSDHEERAALVPIALRRAATHLQRVVPPGPHVYIIGDTDRDIACAKANGCTAVGVGTLNYSAAELSRLGADLVFDDFSDTETVIKTLGVNHGRT